MAYDEALAACIRTALAGHDVTEKRMMGGLCFMLGEHMCCGISQGALMVRVGRDAHGAALAEPHVRPMIFGGRSPTGFVLVDPAAYPDDAALAAWIARGIAVASALPKKRAVRAPVTERPASRHRRR